MTRAPSPEAVPLNVLAKLNFIYHGTLCVQQKTAIALYVRGADSAP